MPTPPDYKTKRHQYFDYVLTEMGHGLLKTWVIARSIEGLSWRAMARQLSALTGELVTDQTLWTWFHEDDEVVRAREMAAAATA